MRALINQMLQPRRDREGSELIGPVLSSLAEIRDSCPVISSTWSSQMHGISTGAVQFRSVSGTNAVVDGLDVVKMDPADKKLFAAIRNDTPLPSLGSTLPITPPSPANTTVEVLDVGNASAANEVEGTLSEAASTSRRAWSRVPAPGHHEGRDRVRALEEAYARSCTPTSRG